MGVHFASGKIHLLEARPPSRRARPSQETPPVTAGLGWAECATAPGGSRKLPRLLQNNLAVGARGTHLGMTADDLLEVEFADRIDGFHLVPPSGALQQIQGQQPPNKQQHAAITFLSHLVVVMHMKWEIMPQSVNMCLYAGSDPCPLSEHSLCATSTTKLAYLVLRFPTNAGTFSCDSSVVDQICGRERATGLVVHVMFSETLPHPQRDCEHIKVLKAFCQRDFRLRRASANVHPDFGRGLRHINAEAIGCVSQRKIPIHTKFPSVLILCRCLRVLVAEADRLGPKLLPLQKIVGVGTEEGTDAAEAVKPLPHAIEYLTHRVADDTATLKLPDHAAIREEARLRQRGEVLA
eukprot:CAMPEP_0115569844 /NCGR_PEP_ID=MMETSP0271-20121206/105398_1 /TAXON_ID=71861 /ORGANISM="Scrippsiella trochoidea, Strain CCMP3099" /LENGTH=350 /DNA_ID=CAMNT_0003004373 /DNA_START=78 /DNA_END=1133 /DNA_ORIENTATION=+